MKCDLLTNELENNMNKKYLNILKNIIFFLFFGGILYFFSKTIYINYDKIKDFELHFNFLYLFLSILFYFLFFFSLTILWKYLLWEKKITFGEIFYINSVSWISKYLPGKVAMIVTKVLYLNEKWIPKRTSFISCIYEHIFQIIASFFISFPFIIYYFLGTENNSYIWLSWIFFAWFIISIHPFIFNNWLNILLKILKKEPVEKHHFLGIFSIIKYIFWYSLSMIIKGISFAFLVFSITSVWIWDIPFLIFAWVFAGVVGIVSIFAPNWLWVREWVLAFLLQFILPVEISIIISIFSRLWSTLCDWIIWLYVGIEKFKKSL